MKASQSIPLPKLPDDAPGLPKGRRYKQQWGVIVILKSEAEQIAVFNDLAAQGYHCKVVCT